MKKNSFAIQKLFVHQTVKTFIEKVEEVKSFSRSSAPL